MGGVDTAAEWPEAIVPSGSAYEPRAAADQSLPTPGGGRALLLREAPLLPGLAPVLHEEEIHVAGHSNP
jgi:hypothetical protein